MDNISFHVDEGDVIIHYGEHLYRFTTDNVLLDSKKRVVNSDATAKIIYRVLDKMNLIDSRIIQRLRDCVSKNSTFVSIPKELFQEVLNNVKSSDPILAKKLLDNYVS